MKKLLALVLALVMTLGLATVGANAADFKDDSSINYKEAVDVMSGIKVIEGDDNGNFNPTGTLTREQAAKIVAYMLMGKSGADSLSASAAPFADVAADRWSAGAISYCATEGIIAGLGDGTFNPTGLLTGHQFAKMLLVALGYNPTYENLVNDKDWAINTAKLAVSAGLEDDLSIVMSQDISRDQAAMMAFNTLKADMVAYENPINVKTSDGTEVIVKADRYKVDDLRGAANIYDGRDEGDDGDVDKFCEVYFPDLKLNKDADSDFNEPVNQWNFKNVTISEEAKKADKVLVGGVTYEDLYAAAGSAAMGHVNKISVYVDGKLIETKNGGGNASSTIATDKANKYWAKDNDDDLSWKPFNNDTLASTLDYPAGNGTITSVFVDRNAVDNGPDTYDINVNVKHVYVGKIASVTEASGSSARKVTITAKTQPSATLTGVTLDNDYETKEFKKDDIVLFTSAVGSGNKATIQSMELATLVSGVEITKVSTEWDNDAGNYKPNKSVVTAGGKDYKLNINVRAEDNNLKDAIKAFEAGDKFDLYLDANGLIAYAEKTEEELNLKNYLVLTKGAMAGNTSSHPAADAVTLDGTKLTGITISKLNGTSIKDWDDVDNANDNNHLELYKVYKYTVKGSDYELKKVGSSYDELKEISNAADLTYTSGKADFFGTTANNATKLFVYDLKDNGVKTYTGIANFPDADTTNPVVAKALLDNNETAKMENANNTGDDAVYQAAELAVAGLIKNGVVVAAVIAHNSTNGGTNVAVKTSVSATDIIYVTNKNYTTSKDGDDTIWTFNVIKDGKVTTISTKEESEADELKADQDLFVIDSYDGDYVSAVTRRTDLLANLGAISADDLNTLWGRSNIEDDLLGNGVYSVSADVTSGVLKIELNDTDGKAIAVNTKAWAVNSSTKFFEIATNGTVTEKSSDNFEYDYLTEGEFSIVYKDDDNVATYVFYQKV